MAGLEWLTYDDFAHRIGDRFDVPAADGASVPLELTEATRGGAAGGTGPDGAQRMQFSLVFRGPLAPSLAQGIHRLVHATTGELELFLVPIGPDSEGLRYEAAFA